MVGDTMATKFKDFQLNSGNYNRMNEVEGASAFVLGVRNILLSKPGNFPLTPSLGMDIEQYLFEIADDITLNSIKTELTNQISKYISNATNVNVQVQLVHDDENINESSSIFRYILGISVSALVDGQATKTNFLLYKDHDLLNVYNETY